MVEINSEKINLQEIEDLEKKLAEKKAGLAEKMPLPEKKEIEIRGPSIGLVDAVREFRKAKGKKVFKKKGYWWFKKEIGIVEVFRFIKKVEREMSVGAKLNNF